MSVRKLTASLLTAFVMLGGVTAVQAQSWDHEPVMVDPFEFEPDFQWFEPVTNLDLADMKPKKRAHTGWFGTYDRLNLYASRPESDLNTRLDSQLDSGWGHRYEIGYMLPDEDTGYTFTWTDLGVHHADPTGPRLRLEFFRDIKIGGQPIVTGTASVNDAEYDSYELNKTWRLEPYHYGGFLEPLVGVRYMTMDDRNRVENFVAHPPGGPPPPGVGEIPFEATSVGETTSESALTENDMFGGQLGFRYFKHRNRFTFSTDFRVFAGASWQASRSQVKTQDVYLQPFEDDGSGTVPADGFERKTRTRSVAILSRNDESFVGFDLRTELAYQLSRHFTVRAGVQVIDVAKGVWRGGDGSLAALGVGDRDQDFLMFGGTFGISLNH